MEKTKNYLNYLINYDRRDKGKNLIICLSIIFVVIAWRLGTGKLYEDFNKFYSDRFIFPQLVEIGKSLYKVSDYLICFTVMFIATKWLKKSNDEYMEKQRAKWIEEEERNAKDEEAKTKQQLETIKEEIEEENEEKMNE
jgi:hypothetical protein